jgi:hypothetical protein
MTRSQEQFRRLLVILSVALSALLAPLIALPAGVAQAETCPNEQLRSEARSTALPDCRAYELVSPPFTEANEVRLEGDFANQGFAAMSEDGSQLAVASLGNLGDSVGPAGDNDYELTRAASGWSETDIDIAVSRFPAGEIAAAEERGVQEGSQLYASIPRQATPNFREFLYQTPVNGATEFRPSSFWIGEADGALHHLGPAEGEFQDASEDLSHVLFNGPGGLEEDQYVAGQELPAVPVGVEPDGNPCAAELADQGQVQPRLSLYEGNRPVSADGLTVFFTCSGELFARIDESRTVAISEPSAADCSACDTSAPVAPTFAGASADGSQAFFTTTQPLLDGAGGLYEYDFNAPAGARVRLVGAGGSLVRVSEDGSHVYFTSGEVLSAAPNNEGRSAQPGAPNLYVYDTETGLTVFIATAELTGLDPNSGGTTSSVTPNGRFLVFASTTPNLTPGDTSTAEQIFEYDAGSSSHPPELVRVSIGQDGFNDNGNTNMASLGAEIPRRDGPGFPVAVSDDGAYVAFESPDGLTKGALNGVDGAENVYEYHDGNVYLISDGQDTSFSLREREGAGSAVQLVGMSPSGDDIFFATSDRLVPQALSTGRALYDAHIDGGFPAPASLLPTCSGDACQGPLSAAPTLLSPGSQFQAGETPPLTAPAPALAVKPKAKAKTCKKGYVKKKNKCVKKPKAKKSAKGRK